MADQLTNDSPVQENVDTPQTDTDVKETEKLQEEGTVEKPAPAKRAVWCLFCHREGHLTEHCPGGEFEANEIDRWALLGSSRTRPTLGEPTAAEQLVNMIALREVQTAEYRSYISERDALFIRICRHTVTHYPTLFETTLNLMTLFNVFVDWSFTFLLNVPCKLLPVTLGVCGTSAEDVLALLRASSATDVVRFTKSMEAIRAAVKFSQAHPKLSWEQYVATTRSELDSRIETRNLDSLEKAWIQKVFLVTVDVQPFVVSSDLYIVCLSYPSIDDVVRAGGLDGDLPDDSDN